MGVNEFKSTLEQGRRLNDTLIHRLYEGQVALGRCVTDENGEVTYSKLKDGQVREQAVKALYQVLINYAVDRWKSGVANTDDKKELAFLTFGLDLEVLTDYVEDKAEKFNPADFMAFAQQKTPLGYFLNRNADGRAKSKLSEDDAEEVVKTTHLEGKVDSAKLGVDEMAELLSEFFKEGTITASFLQDKKYRLEKKKEDKHAN